MVSEPGSAEERKRFQFLICCWCLAAQVQRFSGFVQWLELFEEVKGFLVWVVQLWQRLKS